MYETLRLFPPVRVFLFPKSSAGRSLSYQQVVGIPKIAAEDTTLTTTNSKGERVTVTVPKGAYISLNTAGLHYNRACTVSSPGSPNH